MKNFLLAVSLIGILFSFNSCKKSHTETTYAFTVKVDGQPVTYSDAQFTMTADPSDPNVTDFQIYAGNLNNNINISIQSASAISAGTYSSGDHSPNYGMFVAAFKENGANQENYNIIGPGTGNDPSYSMVITSITATEVRGTITGNYLWDDYDQKAMNVTEGQFVAKKVTQ